ncbi:MAG: hypothetical protein ACJ75K_01210 [Actinomycetes bacterium]
MLDLGGLVAAGAVRHQHGRHHHPLGRQWQLPTGACRLLGAAGGRQRVHGRRGLDRGPPTRQRHRLDLHGHRAADSNLGTSREYIIYAYWTRSGSLPGAILVAWAMFGGSWYLTMALALVFTPPAVPDRSAAVASLAAGRLAGRAATAAFMVLAALKPDLDRAPGRVIANPIGVAWLGDPEESPVGVALLSLTRSLRLAGRRRPLVTVQWPAVTMASAEASARPPTGCHKVYGVAGGS